MNPLSEYLCPDCEQALPEEDINRDKDLAFCRSCGQPFPLSNALSVPLSHGEQVAGNRSVSIDRRAMHGCRIVYRKMNWEGLILLIFCGMWGAGTYDFLGGAFLALKTGNWPLLCFMIPFVAIDLVLLLSAVLLLFGKTVIEVDREQARVFRGVGSIGWSWRFALPEHAKVRVALLPRRQGRREQMVLSVPQPGRSDFRFGKGIADREALNYICMLLNRKSL